MGTPIVPMPSRDLHTLAVRSIGVDELSRRWRVVLLAAVVVFAIAAAMPLGARWHGRNQFLDRELVDRCQNPARLAEPIGEVAACRVIDSGVNLVGGVDCYIFFLLNTTEGLAGVRLDYYNTAGERQHVSIATEVAAGDLAGLTDTERAELDGDIRQRGGLHPSTWTVNHGDG